MAQQEIINIGSFLDDPNSDAIRTAFVKVQNNFTQLFTNVLSSNVNQINPIQGLYEIHGRTVGDLTLATVFPNVTIQTGSNVVVGIANTVGSGGVAMGNSTTITRWDTSFYIDIAPNISITNGNFTSANTTDLTITGVVSGNIVPSANGTYNIGTNTARWKNVYANGSLVLGNVTLSSDANSFLFPNANVTGNIIVSSNVTSNNLSVTSNAAIGNVSVSGIVTATGNVSGANITASANASIGGNLAVTGNITSANSLSIGNISAGNIVANGTANITGNVSVGNLVSNGTANINHVITALANVITANLASIATTTITSSGNISASNVNATFYGAGTGLTGIPGANVTGQVPNSLVTGTVYTNAQPNITSVGTLTSLAVTGNITGNKITATTLVGEGGNISNIAGANVTGTVPGSTTAVTVTGNAQPNITSVGTLANLTVHGNAQFDAYVVGSTFSGSGALLTNIPGSSIVGQVGNAGHATTAGTVEGDQPWITGVGTLTSLTVNGNATVGNLIQNGFTYLGVDNNITAAGSTQSTATALTKQINVIATVAIGQGVKLPDAATGFMITLINTTNNPVNIYPYSGDQIDSLSANVPYILGAKARLQFVATSTTQWYTLTTVYG